MKSYPSIPKEILSTTPVLCFEKLDGSNIRAEWSRNQGFYKFGSRKRLIDNASGLLSEAIGLIKDSGEPVAKYLTDNKIQQAVVYYEFYGPQSFAGQHEVEPHLCALLDLEVASKGFLSPRKLVDTFGALVHMPKLLTDEEVCVTPTMEAGIRSGHLWPLLREGVVCKTKTDPKLFHNVMFKIKTDAWVSRVKALYNDPKILLDLL